MTSSAGQALLGAADIRRLAQELDLRPTKTLGQNFVIDANTVRRIVRVAGLNADDRVVEVGPGLGSLTLALLDAAAHVTAVEIDVRLAARLPATVEQRRPELVEKLRVINADALKINGNQLPNATAMVANLPYNVAVPVLLHLLGELLHLRQVLVMVQAEVADRLCAKPGSRVYGAPSVKVAWWGDATAAGSVSRSVFWPVPSVDSSLISVKRRHRPIDTPSWLDAPTHRSLTFAAIDSAFAQRRKMLRTALASWAGSPARAEDLLGSADVDPTRRAETVDVEAFARLAGVKALADAGP